ncbi:Pkinase domain containing protein [Trichuris trichiura]|uniref:Pkinase domain containing protein n=1 Tax=Trichuris trichiura TaxID=36087 RepID=A0A077Z8J9_TRITR|nr:Pkinase domain containing protein [Trichuris trichiura]
MILQCYFYASHRLIDLQLMLWNRIKRIQMLIYSAEPVIPTVELSYNARNNLDKEAFILRRLAASTHTCDFMECGVDRTINYLVMSLVGPDLAQIRKRVKDKRFNLGTVLRIGIQCAEALSDIHDAGFILRDVRPENFAIGRDDKKDIIYVVDFSIAFQFRIGRSIIRETDYAEFCGSRRYASYNAHCNRELGEHDDMISLFYMLADLYLGKLPWTGSEEIHHIGVLKNKAQPAEIFGDMPQSLMDTYEALKSVIIEELQGAAAHINAPQSLIFDHPESSSSDATTSQK